MKTRLVPLLTACAVLATMLPAQLNGSYTINNGIPTLGTNFNTFGDAVTALVAQGVSGPVTFRVFTGTGPYSGFAIASVIKGASPTNRITFTAAPAQTPIVAGPSGTYLQTIRFGGATTLTNAANTGPKYITVRGLRVQGAPSGAAIFCVGCTDMVIQECVAVSCGAGIYFAQTQSSYIQDCEVNACAMTPGTPGANGTYVGGITLFERSDSCFVLRNRVHDCTGNGIFAGGGGSTTAQVRDDVIANNFVWNCPGASTYPGGISLRRVTGSTVSNNSVIMPAGTVYAGLQIGASTSGTGQLPGWGPAAEVSNNIVRHLGAGPCVQFDVTNASVPVVFNYNHYDVAGTGPLGRVGTNTTTTWVNYATLAAWQANTAPNLSGKELSSIAAAAGFVSGTDLHITAASAAWDSGSSVALVPGDIEQTVRPIGAGADRGAHEVRTPGYGTLFGWSCSGASGPVQLVSSSDYKAGSVLTLTSNNHAASAPGLLSIGASNTSYLSIPLPLLLDPLLGTRACFLNCSLDLTFAGLSSSTAPAVLSFSFRTPSTISNVVVHFQHLCLEPVQGGTSWSNGVTVRFQ